MKKMSFFLCLMICLAGLSQANAQVFAYTVDADGGDNLYSIDLTTGATSMIGPVGFGDVEGLDFNAACVLYGADDGSDELITIDTATGQGTLVGSFGIDAQNPGIAFDDAGNLWMADDNQNFYSVDPLTGQATLVGSTGANVLGLTYMFGTLYAITDADEPPSNLITIDPATAAINVIGPLVNVHVGDGGIAFDATGTLWGLEDGSGGNDIGDTFTIDTATGEATSVATTLDDFESLAICVQAVPVVTPWGLFMFLALLILAAGSLLLRRSYQN